MYYTVVINVANFGIGSFLHSINMSKQDRKYIRNEKIVQPPKKITKTRRLTSTTKRKLLTLAHTRDMSLKIFN